MVETQAVAEVERYIVQPGQACAYKVGMLTLLELRARAQQRLGARFDERAFHDVVLGHGPLPLEVLEEVVNAWFDRAASADRAASPTAIRWWRR